MVGCRRRTTGCAIFTCVSMAALAAFGDAQADEILLDEITVTAARTDRPTSDIPQTVQVVGRNEIEQQLRLGGNSATALSRLVPGYSLSTGTISSASETFRGRNVLIMLDGVPLNTPLRNVSRLAALIDLNAVERIEVVAGASSLYGSNATGGTVNFITRKATEGKPTITAGATLKAFTADLDSSLQPELTASVTGKSATGFDYVFTGTGKLADKTFDGDGREMPSDALLGQGGSDRFEAGNLLGKLGYDFGDGKRLELSASTIYLDQDPDWLTLYSEPHARPDFSSPYTGESILEDSQFYSARYSDEEFALGRLNLVGFYNDIKKRFNYSEFDINYNGTVYYSGNLGEPTAWFNQTTLYSERLGGNLTIDTPLDGMIAGGKLTWGADIVNEKTHQTLSNGEEVFNPLDQTGYAGFAQLQVPFGERITLRGGVRHEYLDLTVDDFVRPAAFVGFPGLGYALLPALPVEGGEFSYEATTFNVGAALKLAEQLELYGGFNQGFNLPDVGAFTRRAGANGGAADILAYGCFLGAGPLPPINLPTCPVTPSRTSISYADIAPEAQIVNSYELGLRGAHGPFSGSVVGYVSTSEDGVTFDPASNTISQQKEIIYGVEVAGEYMVNEALTLGSWLTWREGEYDADKDGDIDSHLPGSRIASPFRGLVYANWSFNEGWMLRLEGEGWSGRDVRTGYASGSQPDPRHEAEANFLLNASLSVPAWGGTAFVGVNNILDTDYENPTASSVRNLAVKGFGRTIALGYTKTF